MVMGLGTDLGIVGRRFFDLRERYIKWIRWPEDGRWYVLVLGINKCLFSFLSHQLFFFFSIFCSIEFLFSSA